jgi:hypothetical protein
VRRHFRPDWLSQPVLTGCSLTAKESQPGGPNRWQERDSGSCAGHSAGAFWRAGGENLGEDPMLAGEIGGAIGDGIRSEGVLAVAKHYVANNFEWLRTGEGSFTRLCVSYRRADRVDPRGARQDARVARAGTGSADR